MSQKSSLMKTPQCVPKALTSDMRGWLIQCSQFDDDLRRFQLQGPHIIETNIDQFAADGRALGLVDGTGGDPIDGFALCGAGEYLHRQRRVAASEALCAADAAKTCDHEKCTAADFDGGWCRRRFIGSRIFCRRQGGNDGILLDSGNDRRFGRCVNGLEAGDLDLRRTDEVHIVRVDQAVFQPNGWRQFFGRFRCIRIGIGNHDRAVAGFVVPADFFVVDNTPHGTVLVRDRRQAVIAERLVRGHQRDTLGEKGGDLHARRQEAPAEYNWRQRRGEQICMKAFDRILPQVSGVTTMPVL